MRRRLAVWLSQFLVGFLTTDSNRIFVALSLDWRIFGFAAALALATCLLFGLLPAIRATRTPPGAAMKAGSRGSTDTRERFGLRRALVIAQVALSLVLVVGALLFVRSLRNLTMLDPGFAQDGVVIASLDLRRTGIVSEQLPSRVRADHRAPGRAARRAGRRPGLHRAGQRQRVEQQHPRRRKEAERASQFQRRERRLFPGRWKRRCCWAARSTIASITRGSKKVAIVNESFVKKFFADRNPIGQGFQIEEAPGAPRPLYEIVGVVKDTKYTDLREPFGPIGYFPPAQGDPKDMSPFMQVVLRSNAPLTTVTSEVSAAVAQINPSIVLQFDDDAETGDANRCFASG